MNFRNSKTICSFIKKSMFNLNQFEFSNAKKTSSNTSTRNSNRQSEKIINDIDEERQCQTINIPIKFCKIKSKRTVPEPMQTLTLIQQWRTVHPGPVDTMGCDVLCQPLQAEAVQKYQTLISLMLSVQTTDQITSLVVKRLQSYGLTPEHIAQTPQTKLIQLIHQSNFNKRKARNIIEVSRLVVQNGLPRDRQALLKLPGVGVKIAMIYLRAAEGVVDGVGVDTHVHRISNRLGWVSTKNPNETEERLKEVFQKQYWGQINVTLVGFGQLLCNAKKPLCGQCPVSTVCPSSLLKQAELEW